jgi:hypothetical protein
MRYYYLFLDESGNFEEKGETYTPSIVAGYLIQSKERQDFSQQESLGKAADQRPCGKRQTLPGHPEGKRSLPRHGM